MREFVMVGVVRPYLGKTGDQSLATVRVWPTRTCALQLIIGYVRNNSPDSLLPTAAAALRPKRSPDPAVPAPDNHLAGCSKPVAAAARTADPPPHPPLPPGVIPRLHHQNMLAPPRQRRINHLYRSHAQPVSRFEVQVAEGQKQRAAGEGPQPAGKDGPPDVHVQGALAQGRDGAGPDQRKDPPPEGQGQQQIHAAQVRTDDQRGQENIRKDAEQLHTAQQTARGPQKRGGGDRKGNDQAAGGTQPSRQASPRRAGMNDRRHILRSQLYILNKTNLTMSLFYKNKPEENLYPDLDHPAREEPKHSEPNPAREDATFKKKEDYNSRASVFLSKDKQPEKEPGWCDKCCACFSLEYYKDYFKVTNKDVTKRILCNLKFWSGGFFKPEDQEYDLYGPFWLYTTMIFMVGAVHNVLVYANSSKDTFQYNFAVIGVAMTIFYLLGLALSIGMGLIFGCLGLQSKTSQIVCLYGYSMATYIICVLLCSINMTLMSWLFLLYGAGSKVAFILKNVFESLEVPTSKKFMITLIVVIEAAVQFLIIKFAFIKTQTTGTVGAAFSHMSVAPEGMLHLRSFPSL